MKAKQMKNISILDCTLRDGGRIIDCAFKSDAIVGIGKQLKLAGINIIEMGFLRNGTYAENSTFFSSVYDADKYIHQVCSKDPKKDEQYVLFMDYGLYDIGFLSEADRDGVGGIRYGFTRKDFLDKAPQITGEMQVIKSKGYDLYLQDVNTNGYNEEELIKLICMANSIHPVSFGIVDTYGSMYLDDLEKVWNIVDSYLDKDIAVDFHSHNNMQMSFALTQRLIQLSGGKRKLIIDSTLNGMGKCAGNLNTELIVDLLARKYNYDYDIDVILDAIDRYLVSIKRCVEWGYSIPAFMAGIYSAHPNNIIYLTEKYRLNSKDIKYIISAIDEKTRQRYDYDNINKIYRNYCSSKIDDTLALENLKSIFVSRRILIMAPGRTIEIYHDELLRYIKKENPVVICVNFVPTKLSYDYLFYANTIHWEKISDRIERDKCILTSNIHTDINNTYLVDYSRLISEDSLLCDNSTIMLLNLLKVLEVKEIGIAGFDGLKENEQNYVDDTFPDEKKSMTCGEINVEIRRLLMQYRNKIAEKIKIKFVTPSIYEG